jgi:hypothetical protein
MGCQEEWENNFSIAQNRSIWTQSQKAWIPVLTVVDLCLKKHTTELPHFYLTHLPEGSNETIHIKFLVDSEVLRVV